MDIENGMVVGAQDEYDAGLDKAEERRIWVETRARELRTFFTEADAGTGIAASSMAWEVDAVDILKHVLAYAYSRPSRPTELKEYLDTELLKYCFVLAEAEAKDHGY